MPETGYMKKCVTEASISGESGRVAGEPREGESMKVNKYRTRSKNY